jgi:hypothetical protein
MVARQDGVEGSRPMPARQDGVEGSRPMPANGQPPMDAQRRMPQRPYLRGAGQGPPPPMRFGQKAGQPGQPGQPGQQTGPASGQFPMTPAGQGPAPARHRPQAPAQPDTGETAQPTAASPLPAPPAESGAAPAESRSYPVHASPEAPRGRPDVASSRSERLANRAPVADRSDTATAAPDREDESSPIFEAMASAWFRENWEVGARKGGGATGLGRDEPADPGAGWSGDESTLQPMPEPVRSELTTAGLPKRQPRSNLIPGGPSEDGGGTPPGIPARSAEQVRGRLASYQQGVRQGRESRHRRSTEPASTGGRQSQENFGEENS